MYSFKIEDAIIAFISEKNYFHGFDIMFILLTFLAVKNGHKTKYDSTKYNTLGGKQIPI